jgi:hypothetical protein
MSRSGSVVAYLGPFGGEHALVDSRGSRAGRRPSGTFWISMLAGFIRQRVVDLESGALTFHLPHSPGTV